MPRWHTAEVETDHGPRWVVENDQGEQQHHGHRYADRALADKWTAILNAYHLAWGMQEESHDRGTDAAV